MPCHAMPPSSGGPEVEIDIHVNGWSAATRPRAGAGAAHRVRSPCKSAGQRRCEAAAGLLAYRSCAEMKAGCGVRSMSRWL